MKNLNNHINTEFKANSELSFDRELEKKHKEDLGLGLPEDYFSKSKMDILEKVSINKETKIKFFSGQRIIWFAAASIALIFALAVFKPNAFPSMNGIPAIVSDTIDLNNTNNLAQGTMNLNENEILITSLFIEDTEIDEFVNNYVIEELVYDEILAN